MYEHHKRPLASNAIPGLILLMFSPGIGMPGYHFLHKFHLDAK
jgi:hypothetical protein